LSFSVCIPVGRLWKPRGGGPSCCPVESSRAAEPGTPLVPAEVQRGRLRLELTARPSTSVPVDDRATLNFQFHGRGGWPPPTHFNSWRPLQRKPFRAVPTPRMSDAAPRSHNYSSSTHNWHMPLNVILPSS
jgi:hypothetical protein